jgi:hypothetical protein
MRAFYYAGKTTQEPKGVCFPGNVRELQNVIERAVILCEGETFSVEESWLKRELPPKFARPEPLNGVLVKQEKQMIEAALAESNGRISGPTGAAAKLGLPSRTLDSKIKRLKIFQSRSRNSFGQPRASRNQTCSGPKPGELPGSRSPAGTSWAKKTAPCIPIRSAPSPNAWAQPPMSSTAATCRCACTANDAA